MSTVSQSSVLQPFNRPSSRHSLLIFATIETRRKLGSAIPGKEFWDGYWGQGKKLPIADWCV